MLSDLHYFQARTKAVTHAERALAAMRWRVEELEPMLIRLRTIDGIANPRQRCRDLLHHRYMKSVEASFDVISTQVAFDDWQQHGCPDYQV